MSASVRQGRIPELKYFTTEYNRKKIKQHKNNLDSMLLMHEGYDIEEGFTDEGIKFKKIGNKSPYKGID